MRETWYYAVRDIQRLCKALGDLKDIQDARKANP
jgi:hypothetical protein